MDELQSLVPEAKLDSFNLPYYGPTAEEVRRLIEAQECFILKRLEVFNMEWDPDMNREEVFDEQESGKFVSDMMRSVGDVGVHPHVALSPLLPFFLHFGARFSAMF